LDPISWRLSSSTSASSVELNTSANSNDKKPAGESNMNEKLVEAKSKAKGRIEEEAEDKTAEAFMPPWPGSRVQGWSNWATASEKFLCSYR